MRWISSTKRTSRSSSPVRIAAMSPFRSSAGPATVRMPTPSSSRTIWASVVLPSPGGPTRRTWSSASPRAFAAASAIASCSLTLSCPTKSASVRGRSERSSSSSSGPRTSVATALTSGRLPQSEAHALLGRELRIDSGEGLFRLDDGVAELDERVARSDVARTFRPRSRSARAPRCRASPSARARSARPSSFPPRGSPGSAPCPAARSRAAARPRASPRRSRAPPSARSRQR